MIKVKHIEKRMSRFKKKKKKKKKKRTNERTRVEKFFIEIKGT